MNCVQCYELFGGIALKNHAFYFTFLSPGWVRGNSCWTCLLAACRRPEPGECFGYWNKVTVLPCFSSLFHIISSASRIWKVSDKSSKLMMSFVSNLFSAVSDGVSDYLTSLDK